ncbi:MAG: hypothetical protein Q8K36_02460, partial [Alphaproteobacteria bacterium]|nr:hypothetical protein [Alphaproteobacteria bacterium]
KSDLFFQHDYDLMESVFKFAGEIRSLKGLLGVQPGIKIDIQMKDHDAARNIVAHQNLVCHLARLQQLCIQDIHNKGVPFVDGVIEATAILGQDINLMDLKKLLDTKVQKLSLDIERLDKKIQNEAYKKAKPDDWAEDQTLCGEKRIERDKIISIQAAM